jgi:hypothetical protein
MLLVIPYQEYVLSVDEQILVQVLTNFTLINLDYVLLIKVKNMILCCSRKATS